MSVQHAPHPKKRFQFLRQRAIYKDPLGFLISLIKKGWISFVILLIIMAVLFSLFRALTPWVKEYKIQIEQHLSSKIGQPVKIGDLETSWYWFQPVLKLDQIKLSDPNHQTIQIHKLLVGINLFNSLIHWQIRPGVLYIDGVSLSLRQSGNQWQLDGIGENVDQSTALSPKTPAVWGPLLEQEKIILKHVSGTLHFENGSSLPIKQFNFTASRSFGHYRLSGRAQLDQKTPTVVTLIADLQSSGTTLNQISGQIYVDSEHLKLTQWQAFWPKSDDKLLTGEGSARTWFEIANGQVTAIQSTINGQNITWTDHSHSKKHVAKQIQANIAWKTTRQGWQLTGDHIQLNLDGVDWPENTILLRHRTDNQSDQIAIKSLLIKPLIDLGFTWPKRISDIQALNPTGELDHTHLKLVDHQLTYVLTRFQDLSWQAHDEIPAVRHISGVLSWQPEEGRLELDGENTTIKPKNLPQLTFGVLNTNIEWKQLTNGLRISMDRFILSHPTLLISARGAVDLPSQSNDGGQLRLTAEFSAKEARHLLAYIPSQHLKPKLNEWLKQNIKRIATASGHITINGPLTHFPFDDQSGEFIIRSHVSGVDLLITPEWPLNRDIDAEITVNKRQFDATIFHAKLDEIPVEQLNLSIPNIGLGQEALLIHGQLMAPAKQIKTYLFHSPLKTHLTKLQYVNVHQAVDLDLQLDIPLYPERDQVYARGRVIFQHNPAFIQTAFRPIRVDEINGELQFNEHGITNGQLDGQINGAPVTLQARSIADANPYTEILLTAHVTAELLKKTFPFTALTLIDGHAKLNSLLTLHESPSQSDHLTIQTDLAGIAINLPKPIGKTMPETIPLNIEMDFAPNRSILLNFQYDNELDGRLLFELATKGYHLQKGALSIGKTPATLPKSPGFAIHGILPVTDLERWRQVIHTLSEGDTHSEALDQLHSIDLTLQKVNLLHQSFDELHIDAEKISRNDWRVLLSHKNVSGELHYQPKQHLITGHLERLLLDKPSLAKSSNQRSTLKPTDIPNLDLTVDKLQLGDVDAGRLSIKSISNDHLWQLEYCNLKTPVYQFSIRGTWTQTDKLNSTTVQAGLQLQNLSQSLDRWHLTPAVQAHYGNLEFEGEWPGAFYDFSLERVSGKLNIVFKDGHISHFDPETEQKLGLGKLLSIMSLQTIPRRLKLDFSDLSQQGYSFDIFKGNFDLKRGVMHTNNSYIDGPVAYASMKGDLDLSKQLYDVDLRITPYITASLPIVATIAGGPIAGVATWVASNIINKGMQKISGYTYKVSGPWADPVVQQVKIFKRRD